MIRHTSGPMLLAVLAAVSLSAQEINPRISRQFGHPRLQQPNELTTIAPNFVEGRELNSPRGLAFDTSVNPPILYVADTGNNRVLAWRNPANLQSGAMADAVIGQPGINDFYSTRPGGPGTNHSRGFSAPTGVAVDSAGNLYVADAGNNRILRFPKPLDQQGEQFPDLVIGQLNSFSGNSPNRGGTPTANRLALFRGNTLHTVGMTFDNTGNLWVTDGGNNRVLRFPVSELTPNKSEPAADKVIGQQGVFTSDTLPTGEARNQINGTYTQAPNGIAFDSQQNLYVTDVAGRALYFLASASGDFGNTNRVLGIRAAPPQGQQPPPYPTDTTLGFANSGGTILSGPQCVFTLGVVAFVCDSAVNRIVKYPGPADWTPFSATQPSPRQDATYGQSSPTESRPNRGAATSSANSFASPIGGAVLPGGGIWIVDSGNHRVLKFLPDGNLNLGDAVVVLGQLGFQYSGINLVEGRDLSLSGVIGNQSFRGSSIVIDKNSTPPHLYISDPFNNRVLGFRDARTVGADARTLLDHSKKADIVIGQIDLGNTMVNSPSGDAGQPSDEGLFAPTGLAVAPNGDLYVADSFNGRVLRFPKPFELPQGQRQRANLVLGQQAFNAPTSPDPSQQTMLRPVGIALFAWGGLAVSDRSHNRVLIFHPNGGNFTNFQVAAAVLGQPNFTSTTASSAGDGLNAPRGMDVDGNDRLYVADTGNNRVVVYGSTSTTPNGAPGTTFNQSMNQPEDVAISSTGVLWVASTGNSLVNRYLIFDQMLVDQRPTGQIPLQNPLALALDPNDNLIVADLSNRMSYFYYRSIYRHAAIFTSGTTPQPSFAPNTYTVVGRASLTQFDLPDTQATIPYPKELAGVQVLIGGIPAPISSIQSGLIYFIVPNTAPTSGEVEILVFKPATGEILGAGFARAGPWAPGMFTTAQSGLGPIAAVNGDNTINSAANPVGRGEILTLYLTGYGHIPGLEDGKAPGAAIRTPNLPRVYVGGSDFIPDGNVLYSGTSPEYPGLWQINVKIPGTGETGNPVAINGQAVIAVQYGESVSNVTPTNNLDVDRRVQFNESIVTKYFLKP